MKLNLNFASRSYINRKHIKRVYLLVTTGLICLLLWLLSQILLTQTHIQQSRMQLATLQQDEQELLGTKSISLDSQRVEEIRKEFARDQKLLTQDSFRWTALFDRMERLLPTGVSIRGFKPDYKDQSLVIEGVAKNLTALQTLLDRLLESESISSAYLTRQAYAKVRDTRGKEHSALNFSINLEGVF